MLRFLVALLLAANAIFFAWSRGWLGADSGAMAEREPARLQRQVRPDGGRVLPPQAASAALAAADAERAPRCVEAGPFAPGDIGAAEQAMAALPPSTWARVPVNQPGRWIV